METSAKALSRTLLYALSGGALSVLFVVAAAQQAEAAPAPPPPKATDSGMSGRNEQRERKSRQAQAENKSEESRKQAEKGRKAKEDAQRRATADRERKQENSSQGSRNEQRERKSRQAQAENKSEESREQAEKGRGAQEEGRRKAEEDRRAVEERKRENSGQGGRNEQRERKGRQQKWEQSSPENQRQADLGRKKQEESRRTPSERERENSGQSGRNEQRERKARQQKWEEASPENQRQADLGRKAQEEGRRKAEEANRQRAEKLREQAENRKAVDRGQSGRNEQTGRTARQAQWERTSAENRRQAELGRQAEQNGRRKAEEARRKEENKSWLERTGDRMREAEEAFEEELRKGRDWAEDQINQERADPDKDTDAATGVRRFSAGVYKSVHDNAHAAGEYMDKLARSSEGDLQAQREIEQDAKDFVDGAKRTVNDVVNDPRGAVERVAEAGRRAVENFQRAPVSGAGELVGNLAGVRGLGSTLRNARDSGGDDDEPAEARAEAPPSGSERSAGRPGDHSSAPGGEAGPRAPQASNQNGSDGPVRVPAADRAAPGGDGARSGPAAGERTTSGDNESQRAADRTTRDNDATRAPVGGAGDRTSRADTSRDEDGQREPANDGDTRRGPTGAAEDRAAREDTEHESDTTGNRADRDGDNDSRRGPAAADRGDDEETVPPGAIPYHGGDSDFRPIPAQWGDQPVGPPTWTRAETVQPASYGEVVDRPITTSPRAVRWEVEQFKWDDDPDSAIARYAGKAEAAKSERPLFGEKGKLTRKVVADASATAGFNHGLFTQLLGQDLRRNTNGWGAEASAKGGIAQKGSIEYDSGATNPFRFRAKGEGSAGVEGKVTARSNKNTFLLHGEALAGAKGSVRVGGEYRGFGISANAELLTGLGLLGKLGLEKGPDGRMHLSTYLGGAAGIGAGAGFDLTFHRDRAETALLMGADWLAGQGRRSADAATPTERGPEKRSAPVKKNAKNKGNKATKTDRGRKG
ncbi:hypothetical protein L3Q67_38515 [Saccharothrix sp. AJ9571]|nr:hypothetical protein L3Q67_38515 [Saccharothrix sp. AJ9571]